jgi:hypothetical protein
MLTIDHTNVKDWEDLLVPVSGERESHISFTFVNKEDQDCVLQGILSGIVSMMPFMGVPDLNKKGVKKLISRWDFLQRLQGSQFRNGAMVGEEDILKLEGLKMNCCSKTKTQFLAALTEGLL